MPNLGFNFNPDEVPESEFEPIPAGWYTCVITNSELKKTKAGDGEYIEFDIQVVDGEHQGKTIKERINIKNPNEKAVEIGYQTLAKMCKAMGKTSLQDTEELHGIRFALELTVKKSKDYFKDGETVEGRLQNEIKKYSSLTDLNTKKTPSSAETVSSAASESLPPWKK